MPCLGRENTKRETTLAAPPPARLRSTIRYKRSLSARVTMRSPWESNREPKPAELSKPQARSASRPWARTNDHDSQEERQRLLRDPESCRRQPSLPSGLARPPLRREIGFGFITRRTSFLSAQTTAAAAAAASAPPTAVPGFASDERGVATSACHVSASRQALSRAQVGTAFYVLHPLLPSILISPPKPPSHRNRSTVARQAQQWPLCLALPSHTSRFSSSPVNSSGTPRLSISDTPRLSSSGHGSTGTFSSVFVLQRHRESVTSTSTRAAHQSGRDKKVKERTSHQVAPPHFEKPPLANLPRKPRQARPLQAQVVPDSIEYGEQLRTGVGSLPDFIDSSTSLRFRFSRVTKAATRPALVKKGCPMSSAKVYVCCGAHQQ
ncbi:hypothetical protein BDZ90DRAFT_228442 [Jaminaea rosea]|uniref:Uncharacterized protein n=1 Tax=Jaminaea rosea TaxID=1569628 RepID=A0A316UJG7_9BASI|nr:hypothetical protein BDZ90DRAFT_228442 [Jaminaea rosea]PWN25416.1 hypothetical protein BDZ90DRAFT_228442 [Jaminaea rosea]